VFESSETQTHAATDKTETKTHAATATCDVELVADELDELELRYQKRPEPESLLLRVFVEGTAVSIAHKHMLDPELKHVVTLTKSIIGDRREQ